ncbi:MAG: type III glutamate--ammonia ligase [Betaproteobacteria bacterium]
MHTTPSATDADIAALVSSLRDQGVHTLLTQFVDMHGTPKGKWVPLQQLAAVVRQGAGFAGPSIWGTALPRTGPRSEYYARADLATLRALPWMPGIARVACDGFVAGAPFESCPRQVLRRATERLAQRGWTLQVGIEPEFFLLKNVDGQWRPFDDADRLDKPSYDLKSLPRQQPFLIELRLALEAAGMTVQQTDHEDAHGQYEINFENADALASADNVTLFKLAAHTLAERSGAVFSMMPKPFADQPGSGLHFHVSLWEGERCVFSNADGAAGLSPLAGHFVAGVLAHSSALTALAAPTVNSYKRLVVGESITGTTWAPAYVAHGPNNRTAVVRTLDGRFEWRLPDASANPYLAIAGLIAAGLDGVDRALAPGAPCTDDLFALDLAQIRARGIPLLPQSLLEAVDALRADEVVRGALGAALADEFDRLKRLEWTAYARHVSAWELARYATAF